MSFIFGYVTGIATIIVALVILVVIGKAKQSYDNLKYK
jgi:hypothetical protein